MAQHDAGAAGALVSRAGALPGVARQAGARLLQDAGLTAAGDETTKDKPAARTAGGQVEHALAHVGHWQGRRACYLGTRKNLFDLRRVAVVHNLHIIARQLDDEEYQLVA